MYNQEETCCQPLSEPSPDRRLPRPSGMRNHFPLPVNQPCSQYYSTQVLSPGQCILRGESSQVCPCVSLYSYTSRVRKRGWGWASDHSETWGSYRAYHNRSCHSLGCQAQGLTQCLLFKSLTAALQRILSWAVVQSVVCLPGTALAQG